MTETRLILVRHGHHNPAGRFQQHTCSGLTAVGSQQAEALADRLAAEAADDAIAAVLTSRAARAVQTGRAVAEAVGLSPRPPTCDLCEMHPGAAEGLTYSEMMHRFGPTYADVPGAEYFPHWLPRGTAALQDLGRQYLGRTVVAVTHNGVVKASFVAFGGMPADTAAAVRSDNTGITVWTHPDGSSDSGGDVWTLERHNDTAHLT